MRTNIEIDDELMRKAMAASKAPTKKAAVEEALRLFVQIKDQAEIRKWRGKVVWRGPDDDWLASDEEVLRKRDEAARHSRQAAPAHPENLEPESVKGSR